MQNGNEKEGCRLLSGNLFAYLDDQLPPGQKELIRHHLEVCDACRELLTEFTHVNRIMEEQRSVEPLPFAESRVLQSVENALDGPQEGLRTFLGRILQPSLISAGVMAAIVLGVIIGQSGAYRHPVPGSEGVSVSEIRYDLNIPESVTEEPVYITN